MTKSDIHGSLSPEVKQRLKELHEVAPQRHLKILVLIGIWIAAAALALEVDSLWVRLPCWVLIGFCLHGLGIFVHEGAHHNLFRKPKVDRLIGFACGIPVALSCSNYRATHMLHHEHENTMADPDNLSANFPDGFSRRLVYYAWYVVGMPIYVVWVVITGPFRASGWREKAVCVMEGLALAGIYLAVAWAAPRYGLTQTLLVGWLGGLVVTILIANVRGLAEHTMLRQDNPPDPLQTTRALPSNPFVSFFFNNQNYHLEHHLFPAVPWYNLAAIHRLLRPLYEREHAAVCRGYLEYIGSALRYGPMRSVRYGVQGKTSIV
jgi:fatty acid desaturase